MEYGFEWHAPAHSILGKQVQPHRSVDVLRNRDAHACQAAQQRQVQHSWIAIRLQKAVYKLPVVAVNRIAALQPFTQETLKFFGVFPLLEHQITVNAVIRIGFLHLFHIHALRGADHGVMVQQLGITRGSYQTYANDLVLFRIQASGGHAYEADLGVGLTKQDVFKIIHFYLL